MPTDGHSDPPADGGDGTTDHEDGPVDDDGPTDEVVVQTAAEAAEGLVFSRYRQSEVRDLDVTVTFEDGVLDVDVYLNAPDVRKTAEPSSAAHRNAERSEDEPDPEQVADDAALAARSAVDDLFDEA